MDDNEIIFKLQKVADCDIIKCILNRSIEISLNRFLNAMILISVYNSLLEINWHWYNKNEELRRRIVIIDEKYKDVRIGAMEVAL